MSVEMLQEANPVPPDQTAGSVHEERAQRLLASILTKEPSRSFVERLRVLAPPRLVRTIAVVGALALIALMFSVTLPFGGGSGGGKVKLTPLDRAAAAIPNNGPIVHVVWRQPDFSSYNSKMTLRYEEWADRASGADHVIIRKGRRVLDIWTGPGRVGRIGKNTLLVANSGAYLLGGIAGSPVVTLMGKYKKALEQKRVVVIRRGRAFGRPVYWVKFRCTDVAAGGVLCMERIGLDRHSYLPVAEEMHDGFKLVRQWNRDHTRWFVVQSNEQSDALMKSGTGVPIRRHILKVEMISREQAHFRPPEMRPPATK
ncbi:MAG TPA: hypothetical protein VIJ84_01510 [Gaiellaceae bacterium]